MHSRIQQRYSAIQQHGSRRGVPAVPDEGNDIDGAIQIARECVSVGAFQQALVMLHIALDKMASSASGLTLVSKEGAEAAFLLGETARAEMYIERALHSYLLCAAIREHLHGAEHRSALDARVHAYSLLKPLFPAAFAQKLQKPEDVPTLADLEFVTSLLEELYLAGMQHDVPELIASAVAAGLDVHYVFVAHGKQAGAAILEDYIALTKRTDLAESPLMLCARRGALKVAQLLLESGACNASHFELHGISPLIVASARGDGNMVRLLLENGASAGASSKRDGSTALHAACTQPELNSVLLLIGAGADVNQRNTVGETPLMIAAMNGHLATVEALLEHKADLAAAKPDGVTALFFAAQNGHESVCQILLNRGSDANAERTEPDELSVLQIAAAHGHTAICELLVAHGARAYHRARDGKVAADLARERGFEQLALGLSAVAEVQ